MATPQVGYVLKQAQSLLRLRMEEALKPLQLTVSQYSCLHLLRQEPGISAEGLARGTFVTRQSMNVLVQALERDGYVTRPTQAPVGKVLPTALTPRGRRSLDKASAAVRSVEVQMLSGLTQDDRSQALTSLRSMVQALHDVDGNS